MTRLHGLIPADRNLVFWHKTLKDELPENPTRLPAWVGDNDCIKDEDGYTYVCTDGSCLSQDHSELRRAGGGIYGGPSSSWHFSYALPGPNQSSERAELHSLVYVAEGYHDQQTTIDNHGGFHVILDNYWVVTEANAFICGRLDLHLEHHDLWRRFLTAMSTATKPLLFKVSWTPGHVGFFDVECGLVESWRKNYNDAADDLAKTGAKMHAFPNKACQKASERLKFGERIQRFIATMVHQRKILDAGRIDRAKKQKRQAAPAVDEPAAKRARNDSSLADAKISFPGYPWNAPDGGSLSSWNGICLVLPTWKYKFLLPAVIWYWTSLRWPQNNSITDYSTRIHDTVTYKGCTWIEFFLDFILATGQVPLPLAHDLSTNIVAAANAFIRGTRLIASANNNSLPWCGVEGRVGTLTPFGVRFLLAGTNHRPALLSGSKVGLCIVNLKCKAEGSGKSFLTLPCTDILRDIPNKRQWDPIKLQFTAALARMSAQARPPGQASLKRYLGV
jgi:hypothetical protein